jgi:thioredoxin-related protein
MIVLFYLEGQSPSEMFKDSLIYHQSKLSFQPGKFLPNISAVNASRPNGKNLAKVHKISEFPTLILFNNQGKAIRTIIGYSLL